MKYPEQHFQEELLADKGYRFVFKDDYENAVWRFIGFKIRHTVMVTTDGKVIELKENENES